jgi:hypothetical protein
VVARLPTLVLAALALLAVGCGGSGSDADDAVRDYLTAIVQQNGARACAQLTEELRRDIERSPAARVAGRSCADVMGLAAGLNPGLSTEDIHDLDIAVEEHGDKAVASLENPLSRREETIDLVRVGGDWKISTLETRPRG